MNSATDSITAAWGGGTSSAARAAANASFLGADDSKP
jgi:hypothetical protein